MALAHRLVALGALHCHVRAHGDAACWGDRGVCCRAQRLARDLRATGAEERQAALEGGEEPCRAGEQRLP